MNILVVGSGGREHAIIKKLSSDNYLNHNNNKLFCIGPTKNPGIVKYTQDYLIESMDSSDIDTFANVIQFIYCNDISLVVIGPEKYLEMGLSDVLNEINIPCVGPTKSFAQIETSKGFLRNIMIKYNMKEFCPKYKVFSNKELDQCY
jgi:phosphoribosylamine---glycine ligase